MQPKQYGGNTIDSYTQCLHACIQTTYKHSDMCTYIQAHTISIYTQIHRNIRTYRNKRAHITYAPPVYALSESILHQNISQPAIKMSDITMYGLNQKKTLKAYFCNKLNWNHCKSQAI